MRVVAIRMRHADQEYFHHLSFGYQEVNKKLFTDGPVTPTRVETLLDLLRGMAPNKKITRSMLYQLLQPEGLPEVDPKKRDAARDTVKSALELGLIEETDEKFIKLKFGRNDSRTTTRILLDALDAAVLADINIEPFLARFYSYVLSLDKQGRSEEHTSELQSLAYLVCRLLLEKKKNISNYILLIK